MVAAVAALGPAACTPSLGVEASGPPRSVTTSETEQGAGGVGRRDDDPTSPGAVTTRPDVDEAVCADAEAVEAAPAGPTSADILFDEVQLRAFELEAVSYDERDRSTRQASTPEEAVAVWQLDDPDTRLAQLGDAGFVRFFGIDYAHGGAWAVGEVTELGSPEQAVTYFRQHVTDLCDDGDVVDADPIQLPDGGPIIGITIFVPLSGGRLSANTLFVVDRYEVRLSYCGCSQASADAYREWVDRIESTVLPG